MAIPEKPYKLLYPMRVCFISASHNGTDNFMPAAWFYPVSASPPLFAVAVGKQRFTYSLIKSSGYFAVSTIPFEAKEKIEKFGRTSGRDGDKFAVWGFKKEKCEHIPSVAVSEGLETFELKVINELEIGDHSLFIGELVGYRKKRDGKALYQGKEGFIGL